MSEILIGSNPDNPHIVGVVNFESSNEEKAKALPEPSGYRILVAIPEQEKEYESGILKSDKTMQYEEVLSTVFFVVKMGPDCYQDKGRFPNGPWCKVGDFILARPNSGTRLKIHGREFRILNDDSVEGIVQDPRGITRV
ncbi:MAG: Chaperonin 10 Kd subunit [Pseudomonadota bacterium]|jgi:co-chaperonin GroES (HSP10)